MCHTRLEAASQTYDIYNNEAWIRLFKDLPRHRLADYYKAAVIRDPLERFLSGYGDIVVRHRWLSIEKAGHLLAPFKLPPDPDLETFIDLLEGYQRASSHVFHHTRPVVDFLGRDAEYYTKLYRMDELGQFAADVEAIVGKEVPAIEQRNKSGSALTPDDLTPKHRQKLLQILAQDYATFGGVLEGRG